MNIPYIMARICEFSYFNESKDSRYPHTQKILGNLKQIDNRFFKVHGFNVHGSQAIVVEHEMFNAVCFRGTDEGSDWIKNLSLISSGISGYSVHSGFKNALDNVYSTIKNRMHSVQEKPLYITGHSLGGAMAVICAIRFLVSYVKFEGLYTFGQPRVFKRGSAQKFARLVKGRYFRYENNNDAVIHLPPWLLNYVHCGALRYIDMNGKTHKKFGLFRSLFDHGIGLARGLFEKGVDLAEDHDIKKYAEAVK